MNVMAIEDSPIYEAIISELGNPVATDLLDCSYQAVIAMAAAAPPRVESVSLPKRSVSRATASKAASAASAPVAEPVSLAAAPKRAASKTAAPKQMASAARDAG